MKDTKPQPKKPKFELREAAKPLAGPPEREMPAADHPVMEIFRQAQQSVESVPQPSPPPAHPQPTPGPVAAERDYYKRPNSIERDAVPAGLFPGGTKHTYDALFQRTRGAIVPTRSIQATKRKIMQWADVSNEKTIEAHIKHLCALGLLIRTGSLGDNKGQFYEVVTPEELGLTGDPSPAQAHPQPRPTSVQKSAPPQAQKLPPGGLGQTVEAQAAYGDDKTSFKTNTERSDDDEAFGPLLAAARELTGKEIPRVKWHELAEVLATELRIAAGRTTVSSPPAFLSEHLRRRLFKKDKAQLASEGNSSSITDDPSPKVDVKQCPDCFGAGMYYPNGFDNGVAKCAHEKLSAGKGSGE